MQSAFPAHPKRYFVTGIGTDVGKTIASAILTEALQADYWKPIQAGNLEDSDSHTVRSLVSNSSTVFHPEAYRLQMPASPHTAAAAEGLEISLENVQLPTTQNHLIVEGAGGVMVPLNDRDLVLDLIQKLNLEVVLVSRNYLGSINHTLTAVQVLQSRNIRIAGLIFNGAPIPSSEEFILRYTQLPPLPAIGQEERFDKSIISGYAQRFRNYFTTHAQ